ncbi:pyridoxal-phosphate dependent enzyme [Actinokineospora guangxiensis]|uniref:Pyridoxal-phosphate dependent enzyme n=1 Tax=Actinokineospora guangxiensis TaxID=1490288 RepID=A0ABW0ER54_9PSEU
MAEVRLSPPVELHTVDIPAGTVTVVRDDLLPGGTKQRALIPYLQARRGRGTSTFVYASPAPGFAQVALAHVCALLGTRCVVFAELLDGEPHPHSLLAHEYGAEIIACPSLAEATTAAEAFAAEAAGRWAAPLGFGDAQFGSCLREQIAREWHFIGERANPVPTRVWAPVGSGTLVTALRRALPGEVHLECLDVGVLDPADRRLRALAALPGVSVRRSSQPFLRPCDDPPPIPSNSHYDAKLWPLIREHAAHGDLWWNVAK